MSIVFMPVLVIHVVVAVLGLGSVLSVAVVAAIARRPGRGSAEITAWLGPLLRVSAASLAAMLATGVVMDAVTRGAFHDWWWFRGSALLLVVTGVLHGQARRTVGHGIGRDSDAVLRRVERIAYAMCVLVAAITVLMEAKPF